MSPSLGQLRSRRCLSLRQRSGVFGGGRHKVPGRDVHLRWLHPGERRQVRRRHGERGLRARGGHVRELRGDRSDLRRQQ